MLFLVDVVTVSTCPSVEAIVIEVDGVVAVALDAVAFVVAVGFLLKVVFDLMVHVPPPAAAAAAELSLMGIVVIVVVRFELYYA